MVLSRGKGQVISIFAHAEQSTNSTGQYEADLGQVYGAIQAVKYLKEICAESFPDYVDKNETAYQKWRVKHKSFLQEIERHFSSMLWQEAGHNPEKHMEVLTKYDNGLLGYKKGFAAQLRNDGQKVFDNTCKAYPVYLTTDRADFEYFYAEQVATIRGGSIK